MMEQLPSYIDSADTNEISAKPANEPDSAYLKSLGFSESKRDKTSLAFMCADEKSKADMLMKLRDRGFCFSYGKEWNPADVFLYLSEKGLTHGSFKKIAWTGKDLFNIIEQDMLTETQMKSLLAEMGKIEVDWSLHDLESAGEMVSKEMHARHPELSAATLRTLVRKFTFDWR